MTYSTTADSSETKLYYKLKTYILGIKGNVFKTGENIFLYQNLFLATGRSVVSVVLLRIYFLNGLVDLLKSSPLPSLNVKKRNY